MIERWEIAVEFQALSFYVIYVVIKSALEASGTPFLVSYRNPLKNGFKFWKT